MAQGMDGLGRMWSLNSAYEIVRLYYENDNDNDADGSR